MILLKTEEKEYLEVSVRYPCLKKRLLLFREVKEERQASSTGSKKMMSQVPTIAWVSAEEETDDTSDERRREA